MRKELGMVAWRGLYWTKRLKIFNSISYEDKQELLSWNSLAYELNFRELHKYWKEHKSMYVNKIGINAPTVEHADKDGEDYFKYLQSVEKALHEEEMFLKYGSSHGDGFICQDCEHVKKYTYKNGSSIFQVDIKGCNNAALELTCKYLKDIL